MMQRDAEVEYQAALAAMHAADAAHDRVLAECRERVRAAREWLLETKRRVAVARERLEAKPGRAASPQ